MRLISSSFGSASDGGSTRCRVERHRSPVHRASRSALGDITFEVGFVLAAVVFVILFRFQRDRDAEEAAVIE
jgi:hypothetical protein